MLYQLSYDQWMKVLALISKNILQSKLKKLSQRFNTLSIKNSFHEIQVDVLLDPSKLRRERNMISVGKKYL